MTADFKYPERYLAQANARDIVELIAATADLALVVNSDNVIKDVSHNLDAASGADIPAWLGMPIERVVRVDSRPMLRKAFNVARSGARGARFDVNHLIGGKTELPVQYSALGIGGDGSIILMGRDLRLVSELQSRLLANRQTQEEDARSKKQAEAHYRLLFTTAADAIVIIDAATGKVREANPRAISLLGSSSAGIAGKKFSTLFDKAAQVEVQSVISGVVASGSPANRRVDLVNSNSVTLSVELFRAGDLKLVLVRISAPSDAMDLIPSAESGIATLVRNAAEAVVLTDEDGSVAWANESFLTLAEIPLAAQAVGRSLDDFFVWSGVEKDMLLKNIRRHGRVSAFSATVRGANGQATSVDLSAVAMPDGTTPGYGFVMRALSGDSVRQRRGNSDLTRTAEHLVEMIGRAPMKELVRDTTDVIERMCIEAALKLTGNNRASAARVLGLSRQALYLKMNRFGLADGEPL
ncbi:MAG: transcriptional regulator PpsR [Hyphomicrobiales bacterium]|nr:transcriptional regulator PpsR [Hyphomicrobiales bacterium]